MSRTSRFSSEAEATKHVGQSALIAHSGEKHFYPKGAFITERVDDDDAGKPILLGENGRLDYSLLSGITSYPVDFYDGDYIPSEGSAVMFAIALTNSATTANDYIEFARIEIKGNYAGGWIQLKGLSGSGNREQHPCEIEVMCSNDGSGVALAPVITCRGHFTNFNFFVYLESDGGGSGIHYYHIYYKATANWNSLNATIRARVTTAADCEITVWQTGNNVGESTPTGILHQTNNWWGVVNEFRVYDTDLSDYGSIYAEDGGFFIKSVNDPLYLNPVTPQNIYCFASITSGNPEFKWYGWDTGASAVKYGSVYVSSDGATWIKGEEYLRLCAFGNYVDVLPNNASYGMVLRKHDAAGVAGSPYANFFVEDAAVDYLNIVIDAPGSTFGLVIDAAENLGVGKVATTGYRIDANGIIRGTRLVSSIATGTAPLVVASTTVVPNLNVDRLDGYHSSSFPQLVVKSTPVNVDITADNAWRDLDVTSQTSANATWVYLQLHLYTTRDTHEAALSVCGYGLDLDWVLCKVYGGSRIAFDAHGAGNQGNTYNDTCVWVKLNASRLFTYKGQIQGGSAFIGDATAHVTVLAYIEEK